MSPDSAGLAPVIADLARRLPPEHLAAWMQVLRSMGDADSAVEGRNIEAKLIEAKSGFVLGGIADRLMTAWQAADPPVSGTAIALALESAALVQAEAAAHRSEVVISGPASDSSAVRLTSSVISELIHHCQKSLLIVSFAAFGITEVVHELEKAARRGVRIDLVLESAANDGGTLYGPVGASAAFRAIRQDANFWNWPANKRPAVGASRAALHAKLIAADEQVALLGSANLTDKALASNLELGLIIRDPDVVRSIVHHFRSLMKPGKGPLEHIRDNS
jgi:cardiolipin synthase C